MNLRINIRRATLDGVLMIHFISSIELFVRNMSLINTIEIKRIPFFHFVQLSKILIPWPVRQSVGR